jgi:uncharacterized membrane protein YgdD (TMEM256/DUF423 family)
MHRTFSKLAALIAMTSVLIGAFGAHYLKNLLPPENIQSIETATYYQFVHAIGLFIIANLYRHYNNKRIVWAGNLMVLGVVLFSGSIYLRIFLLAEGYTHLNMVALVTPLGGLSMIISWILVFIGIPSREYRDHKGESE